jgi:hypothetical protein
MTLGRYITYFAGDKEIGDVLGNATAKSFKVSKFQGFKADPPAGFGF